MKSLANWVSFAPSIGIWGAISMVACSTQPQSPKPYSPGIEKVSRRASFDASTMGAEDATPITADSTPVDRPMRKGATATSTLAAGSTDASQIAKSNVPSPQVTGLSVLAAKPGESISVFGSYFRPGLSVKVAGRTTLALTILSASQAAFALPQNTPPGLINIEVEDQGTSVGKFPLVSDSAGDDIPIILADPQLVCTGISFRDAKGQVRKGERACFDEPPYQKCKGDGETNCTLDPSLIAVTKVALDPAVIRVGTTLGGVVGTLVPTPGPCANDGSVDCVANSRYPAVDAGNLTASNIRAGVTLANVTGNLVPSPALCDQEGASGCVASSRFVTVDLNRLQPDMIKQGVTVANVTGSLVPSPALCDKEGASGCVASSRFVTVDLNRLQPDMIKQGVTVANVTGSLVPSPALCDKEGASGCVASSRFVTVDLNRLQPDMIKQEVSIAGVFGTVTPSPAACTTDGATACVATTAFVAVDKSSLTASNIRSGVNVGGVTGQFPSSSYPLTGNPAIPDLDGASFDARLKTGARFQWFDASGRHYEREGDPRLTAENILNGITIFGTTGTILGAVPCRRDGDTQCVVTDAFKAADTTKLEPIDLRAGRTLAGISGSMDFFKNMANTGLFDRTTGAGAQSGLDVYDTIDDHANNNAFPNQVPPGFAKMSGSHWVRDAATDDGLAGGTSSDGLCNGGEACLVKDGLSGLLWTRGDSTQRTWENAISYCDNLNYGGYTDWRLPTQKELMQAYVDGIWSQKGPTKLSLMSYVWSATTVSYSNTAAWLVYLNYGSIAASNKTSNGYALCVR